MTPSPGSICYLVSGSPKMVVLKVDDDGVHCLWSVFNTGIVYRDVFPAFALTMLQGPRYAREENQP